VEIAEQTDIQEQTKRRKWRRIGWAWVAAVCTYFLWETIGYRGLYGLFAEWQIRNYGGYVPMLTFGAWALLFALPGLIVVRRARETRDESLSTLADFTLGERFGKRFMQLLFGAAAGLLLAATATVFWAYFYLPKMEGAPQTITVGDTTPRTIIEGPARLVGGITGRPALFGQFWFIGQRYVAYAPYYGSGSRATNAEFFVQLDYLNRRILFSDLGAPVWNGILVNEGLPGTMRELYGYLGYKPRGTYYTLYQSEAAMRHRYLVHAFQMFIGALLPLALALFQRRKLRKRREVFDDQVSKGLVLA
jgi:hypothetical protein